MPAINHSQLSGIDGKRIERVYQPEPDRVTVRANGIVVDIIGNDDGTVYVEFYASAGPRSAIEMTNAPISYGQGTTPAVMLRHKGE